MCKNLRVFFAAFLILISGCALKNIQDGKKPDPENGLVGFVLKSNWKGNQGGGTLLSPLTFLFIKEGSALRSKVEMTGEENLYLLELESGDYRLEEIMIGNAFFSLEGYEGFRVEPGKMSYLGDMYVNVDNSGSFGLGLMNGARIAVENNINGFAENIKTQYPDTYKNYPPEEKILVRKAW